MNYHKRDEREVSLFRNGRSQAVRIPKEFEIDADKVVMWKDPDGTIHMQPKQAKMTPRELAAFLRSRPPLEEDFPPIEELPLEDVDLERDP